MTDAQSPVKRWYIAIETPTFEAGQTTSVPTTCVIKELDHEAELAKVKAEHERRMQHRLATIAMQADEIAGWKRDYEEMNEQRQNLIIETEAQAKQIAELKAECDRLETACRVCVAEVFDRDETIATQKRVIEVAKRALEYGGLRPPDGGTPTLDLVLEDTRAALKEIEAIENEGRGEK